jgi:hypothetical protein
VWQYDSDNQLIIKIKNYKVKNMEEQILDTPDVSEVGFSKKGVSLTILLQVLTFLTQLVVGYPILSKFFSGKDTEFSYMSLFLPLLIFNVILFFRNFYVLYIPMLRKMWKDDIALVLEDDGFLFYGEPRYIRTKILWIDVVKVEIKKSMGIEYLYMEVEKKPYYDETLIWLHTTFLYRSKTKNYVVTYTNLDVDVHRLKESIENRMNKQIERGV